jgi:hypothetical protein
VQVPFATYFSVEAVNEYHRAITMEDFMKELAPKIWPEGKRTGTVLNEMKNHLKQVSTSVLCRSSWTQLLKTLHQRANGFGGEIEA